MAKSENVEVSQKSAPSTKPKIPAQQTLASHPAESKPDMNIVPPKYELKNFSMGEDAPAFWKRRKK